jgi:hypothetical protein
MGHGSSFLSLPTVSLEHFAKGDKNLLSIFAVLSFKGFSPVKKILLPYNNTIYFIKTLFFIKKNRLFLFSVGFLCCFN